MALRSGFFNSINGDRIYHTGHWAEYFASFIGNGVFPNPSNNLQVASNNNMTVTVKAGKAWINGYILINDSDYQLSLTPADGVLNRIDRIVARYDTVGREITLEVKQGAFASNPVAPTLQRDTDGYELVLADVRINAGVVSVTQANITDTRLNNELCGIVHGVVDQVDTTTLYNQYLSFWNNWRTGKVAEFEQFQNDAQDVFDQQTADNQATFDNQTVMNQEEFDNWFEMVQEILNEDVAGNLLDMIGEINDKVGQPNGIATLDEDGKVPIEELPPMDYVPLSEKGEPEGVATLDGAGTIPLNQLYLKVPKFEYSPSRPPNSTDNRSKGYLVGSRWTYKDTPLDHWEEYVCVQSNNSSAQWERIIMIEDTYYYYINGHENTHLTGGWSKEAETIPSGDTVDFTKNTSYLRLYVVKNSSGGTAPNITVETEFKISLKGIDTLHIDWENQGRLGEYSSLSSRFIVVDEEDPDKLDGIARYQASGVIPRRVDSINVSNLDGEYRLRLWTFIRGSSGVRKSDIRVYKIWGE